MGSGRTAEMCFEANPYTGLENNGAGESTSLF